MKQGLSLIVMLLFCTRPINSKTEPQAGPTFIIQQPQQVQQKPADIDTTPLVLQNFGGMLTSFLNMIQAPDDTEHVFNCVGDMVQGMINIFNVGMRSPQPELVALRHRLEKELLVFFQSAQGYDYLTSWQKDLAYISRSFDRA